MNSKNDVNGGGRFFIKTLGCKVNQYESQAMREILLKAGFKECLSEDMADIYIINTCTVTEHADKESRYSIGLFHRANPKAKIVVAGCYVEKDAGNVSFLPGVMHIVRNEEKGRIAEILNSQGTAADEPRLSVEAHSAKKETHELTNSRAHELLSITDFKDHTKAFVKIQDGCENRCSYCKVSLVRGPLRSKPINDILEEVKTLVKNNFKEIVLTGICLGAWGRDLTSSAIAKSLEFEGESLVDVLKTLVAIRGSFRIRLSSIEPRYVTDELIDFISKNEKICRHLHIPLQSGDDEILKKMNRPYVAASYKALIDKIRARINGIAITTDVLVGFPGESDINFSNTVNFIKEILPSRIHIFTFSKRKGTAAYAMTDAPLDRDAVKKRYYRLKVAGLEASYLYRSKFLNKKLDILVETKRERFSGLLVGYSDNYIKVLLEGPDSLMKNIVPVMIEDLNLVYTIGKYEPRTF